MTDQLSARPVERVAPARHIEYEYVFPAIRGVQAGREYYVTMCPLRLIPRLFLFDEEELPPEMRAQRSLNKARVPEISRYIIENPDSYIFSALTASVNAQVRFEPLERGGGPAERVGTLSIPMSAKFVINDGQHRRAAIQQALVDNPDLGDESIAIVLFLDIGLGRCQQMFADLNRHAIRPSKSIGVLYDHRDEMSTIAKLVVIRSPFLSDLTEMETSNLSTRSRKLFTLSALYSATKALLEGGSRFHGTACRHCHPVLAAHRRAVPRMATGAQSDRQRRRGAARFHPQSRHRPACAGEDRQRSAAQEHRA